MAIQLRRGISSDLIPANILEGELVYCTDTGKLLVGDGAGNVHEIETELSQSHSLQLIIRGYATNLDALTLPGAYKTMKGDGAPTRDEAGNVIGITKLIRLKLNDPGKAEVSNAVRLLNEHFENYPAFIQAFPNYISDDGWKYEEKQTVADRNYISDDWKYEEKYTVADVVCLRSLILSESYSQEDLDKWDLNEDGRLTVADIVCLRKK